MRLLSRCLCPVLATALLLPALSHATVFYYVNNTGITIQDSANASPFPSLVSAPILPAGNAQVARVHLFGFTHTYPDDVDVYLMAPSGKWIVLFSDAGGNASVTGRNFAFSDIAAAALPDSDPLTNGTYRPDPGTEPGSNEFPAEANRVTTLRELTAGGHAGNWGLYVRDDFEGDFGSITGWGIEFDTPPGRMTKSRQFHSATLLSSGKVLVAGGVDATSTVLASTDLYDPVLGGWTAGAPMGTARAWGTATSLDNGRVLVAGGANNGALAQTEIHDPLANTWTPAANLNTARYRHCAVRLFDGRVLVCGGNAWTNGTSLPGCEIYTPNRGEWTTTGNLGTGRYNHTATVLPDGRVLVTGGYTTNAGNQPLATCEIYNPGTGLWTPTGSLPEARESHTATLLHNGVVLVAGGTSNSGSLDTAAIFDPANGSWTATGSLTHRRYNHTATLLPDNTVMVNGGSASSTTAMGFVEIYTPDTGLWTVRSGISLNSRTAHTATLLHTGDVLLAGGGENDGLPRATADMVPFRPAVAWSSFNNVTLNTARQHHTATLLPDGKVLVAGGYTSADLSTLTNTAEIVDPIAGTIAPTANAMAISRASHTATLLPKGDVLVVGGGTTAVDRYHPATRTWSSAAPYPYSIKWNTATLLQDGRVLVAGGSGATRKCRIYDPNTDAWTVSGDLIGSYSEHTATLLPDGRVLVVGGVHNPNQAEFFDPAANGGTGAWTATGSASFDRKDHTATLLPSGKVLVVGSWTSPDRKTAEVYDPQTGTWSPVAAPLYDRTSHRAVLLPDGRVWIQGGLAQTGRDKAEIYDPVRDTWTEVPVSVSGVSGHPYCTLTLLLDGNLLQTGGEFSTVFATVTSSYVGLLNRRFAPPDRAPLVTPFHYLDNQRRLRLRGERLTGLSEASGGNGVQSSAGIPLVQLRRLDNEQITYLPPNPNGGIFSTAFNTAPLNLTPGTYAITVFANAIPSDARVRLYHGEPSIKLVRGPSNTWSALASNLEAETAYTIETTTNLGAYWNQHEYFFSPAQGGESTRSLSPTAPAAYYRVNRSD